jgi:hypothetical protein
MALTIGPEGGLLPDLPHHEKFLLLFALAECYASRPRGSE